MPGSNAGLSRSVNNQIEIVIDGFKIVGYSNIAMDKKDSGCPQQGKIELRTTAFEIIKHRNPHAIGFHKRKSDSGSDKSRAAGNQNTHLKYLIIMVMHINSSEPTSQRLLIIKT